MRYCAPGGVVGCSGQKIILKTALLGLKCQMRGAPFDDEFSFGCSRCTELVVVTHALCTLLLLAI